MAVQTLPDHEEKYKKKKSCKEKEGIIEEAEDIAPEENGKKNKKRRRDETDVAGTPDPIVVKNKEKKKKPKASDEQENDQEENPPVAEIADETPKKKKRKNRQTDPEEAPPKKKKKPSASEDTVVEPPTTEGGSKKKKKKEKRAQEIDLSNPANDSSLSEQASKALTYAYLQFSQPTAWKFNKARQNWLIRNFWSDQAIPESHVPLVLRYLTDVKGRVREALIKSCQDTLQKSSEPGPNTAETKKKVGFADESGEKVVAEEDEGSKTAGESQAHKISRAKQLLKCLSAL